MSDSTPIRHKLVEISPKAYEHPADRAATAALQAIPMLDQVIERLTEFGYERAYRQLYLASSVRIGPRQLPHIWRGYQHVLETLDMPEEYELYISQTPVANAFTLGANRPMIVLNSGLVSLLDEGQVQAVLAHEVGHILSSHVKYRTALLILLALGNAARLPFLVGLPLQGVLLALLEWYRAAELSCDRAATLVVRDPLITCRVLMNLAGGAADQPLDVDAFIQQATEYEQWDDGFDKLSRFFMESQLSHPFPVRRVSELMAWVRSGDFDRIIRGDYPRRSQRSDPRQEANAAASHYSEQFRQIFEEAGANAQSAGQQFSDWLRGRGGA